MAKEVWCLGPRVPTRKVCALGATGSELTVSDQGDIGTSSGRSTRLVGLFPSFANLVPIVERVQADRFDDHIQAAPILLSAVRGVHQRRKNARMGITVGIARADFVR